MHKGTFLLNLRLNRNKQTKFTETWQQQVNNNIKFAISTLSFFHNMPLLLITFLALFSFLCSLFSTSPFTRFPDNAHR